MSEVESPWHEFNGTRNDWAWNYLENYELLAAMEDGNVAYEIMIKELLKTKAEVERLKEIEFMYEGLCK